VILLAGAVFTPPDATSMFVVAGPMYLLYEASIVVSAVLKRRASRRGRAAPRPDAHDETTA
jgi:Sec-independent protein secretion pathway component TatC